MHEYIGYVVEEKEMSKAKCYIDSNIANFIYLTLRWRAGMA